MRRKDGSIFRLPGSFPPAMALTLGALIALIVTLLPPTSITRHREDVRRILTGTTTTDIRRRSLQQNQGGNPKAGVAASAATTTPDHQPPQPKPKVAWLATYPNSGKEIVRHLLQKVSERSMATNYGVESNSLSVNGPFRLANRFPLPERYVLTETHCVGFCFGCVKGMFEKEWRGFQKGCAMGNAFIKGSGNKAVKYDDKSVRKVVHLIRDPFENIAARFHFEYETYHDKDSWNYSMTLNGFGQWCRAFDLRSAKQEKIFSKPEIAELMLKVPCHGLFTQYVLWHNNLNEFVFNSGEAKIKSITVHTGDFKDKLDETVSTLLEFLELPRSSSDVLQPPNIREYVNYYTERDRVAISSFLKVLATQETWTDIKRYAVTPAMERLFSPVGSAMSPKRYGTWPDIAWLLTYPNSGTGFTTALVQKLSRFAAATNYAMEVGGYYDVIPNFSYTEKGPFRYNKRPFPPKFILTKNHCVGHCISCPVINRIKPYDEFVAGCGKVWRRDEKGNRMKDFYHPRIAKRVVHLIRSPFDNVVANFHYEYKYHHDKKDPDWNFPYSKDGFREWCKDLDEDTYIQDTFYNEEIKNIVWSVPCHSVFYQYINWHNNAFRLPVGLGIPEHIVYYEDYHYDTENTIDNLFHFLKLPRPGKVEAFDLHTYPSYFSETERVAVVAFFRLTAAPETLQHINRYF